MNLAILKIIAHIQTYLTRTDASSVPVDHDHLVRPLITWTFVDREITTSKYHSKTMYFSVADRMAFGVLEASANMSSAGMGLGIFKGQHPRLASTESDQLTMLPWGGVESIQAIKMLEDDLRAKQQAGLVVPNSNAPPNRSQAFKDSGYLLQQAQAKMIAIKKSEDSHRLEARAQRVAAYQARSSDRPPMDPGRDGTLLRLSDDIINIVNEGKMSLPKKEKDLTSEAREARGRLLSQVPAVGTSGVVTCLRCLR